MSWRTCGDCIYYHECENEDCPPDKEPHGHCYVTPIEQVWALDDETEEYRAAAQSGGPVAIYADRFCCRFWVLKK